ncbi:MAG: NADH-quinone oxidoreductase subunit L [Robiginitomaculum sp.]|nr:MAG: NADH-quinone oxidoreductase subunit L [Robiginitomaculum sp.]
MHTEILIIVFGPLIGAMIAGLFGRKIGHNAAQTVTTGFLILSALLSWHVFIQVGFGHETTEINLFRWIDVGSFQANWALKIDTLTAVMFVVVNSVSALVHIYSWGYMSEDPHKARFFSYLSYFTFAMLMLVTSNNFIQLFFGWEGVGVASYLLIGFWYKKPSANAAAIKAFVTNRVGDVGLALGIFAIYFVFGSVNFDTVFAHIHDKKDLVLPFLGFEFSAMELIAGLLFIGAMGKSAQFVLHVWLPDAMEGPTPVSALIHAATMVTAGVFLVCRAAPIYDAAPYVAGFITVLGAFTAFFAATVGLVQNDIKRVIAYSTCSQLGYMFFAAGLGAYNAAMFHLFTHAFFKALLFLCAGSVIHALHHEQDMRKMGGIWKKVKLTYVLMIIGTLALTGVGIPGFVGFAGFYSKDAIIEAAYAAGAAGHNAPGVIAFWAGLIAAAMTSFYSWRLIFMTFHGKFRGDHHTFDHAHESPKVMLVPLIVLSIGALFAGGFFFAKFMGVDVNAFWNGALPGLGGGHEVVSAHGAVADAHGVVTTGHGEEAAHGGGHHDFPTWVLWAPFAVTLGGFIVAWFMYIWKNGTQKRIDAEGGMVYNFLLNKWYIDELYEATIIRGTRKLGDLFWKIGDVKIIDGLGPNGIAAVTMAAGRKMSKFQTGFIFQYALVMLVGVAALVGYISMNVGG